MIISAKIVIKRLCDSFKSFYEILKDINTRFVVWMVMTSFIPAEEEKTGESGASTSKTTISINDAAAAFETVYDFLQQGDIEIDYNESKFLKSLKRRLGL